MDDLISRQAAIKDAESWVAVDEYEKHLQKKVVEWLKELPSAQPKPYGITDGLDAISRQDAIDALTEAYEDIDAEWILRKLPSAQPEPYTDALKAEIKRMKRSFTICINSDYYTGYMSALSMLEGYIAQMEVTT